MKLFIVFATLSSGFAGEEVSWKYSQKQKVSQQPEQAAPQQSEEMTPQQIQQQLDQAEIDFKHAQEMFSPWYTGPLITPSATVMDLGYFNIQPYLYVIDTYAAFDQHRKSKRSKHGSQISVNPVAGPLLQFGLTPYTDLTIVVPGAMNWQDGSFGGGIGDASVGIGFRFLQQTPWVPAVKFSIKEIFPTGSYQHLSSNGLGLSATGGGAYWTAFGLSISKIVFFSYSHPMNLRLAFSYSIPTSVRVKGFNTYGGGFKTNAEVLPGNIFDVDLGIEYSITQRWVLALDVAYEAQGEIRSRGYPGTNADGSPASLKRGYRDNLSLAPALEYNWNENLGVIGGAWFSVYGRNSGNFAGGMFSVTYTFKVN
jgi:hypothetical protein